MSHSRRNSNISIYLAAATAGEPPWTSARCNRLLRPITAQIRVLRELVYPQLQASASAASSKDEPASSDKQQEDEETRRKSFDDPDWMPHATEKKGAKRLYTNRNSKAETHPGPQARKPGEISMPTPLIARQVNCDASPRASSQVPAGRQFLQTPKKRRFPMLKHDLDLDSLNRSSAQQLQHLERFLQAFRTLLHATRAPERSRVSKAGSRSLMSTCLRQVPAYIEGRQQWEDDENVNKVDASEEVYQELEQMGSALGWRPLREVTRAHGVALVTEAVAEGLLDTVHIERLVRLCHGSLAYDEAEDILTAFAFATEPLPPPKTAKDTFIYSEDQRFSGIVAAHAWAKKIDGWPFFYRLIRSMLTTNIVPVEWTATTQFKNIWSKVIQHISDSSNPAHAEACELTHVFFLVACGRNLAHIDENSPDSEDGCPQPTGVTIGVKNALNTTVSSLSAIFAAICLLPNREASFGRKGKYAIQHTLESIATDITCDVLGGHLDKPIALSSSTVERLSNILTCAIITGVCTFSSIPNMAVAPVPLNIRALARLEGITGHQLLNLPAIVCSVAETCGKAYDPKTTQNVFLVLRSIVEALKSYRVSSFDDGKFTGSTLSSDWKTVGFSSWILKRLALDSAHEFADHSQDSSVGNTAGYVQYTLEIEKEMENIQMPRHDIPFFHKDVEYHVGYRWESAISEWVEATPLVRMSALGPAADDEAFRSSTTPKKTRPLPAATPARPTLSQLLLLAQSPDVLGFNDDTPAAAAPAATTAATTTAATTTAATTTASFSEKIAAASASASADTAPPPSTPVMTSTPAAALRALRNDTDDDYEHDEHDARADDAEYETDELAFTSPIVRQQQSSSPVGPPRPRKRARKSGGGGVVVVRSIAPTTTTTTTLSAAFGLDGAGDDSEDELGFL